MHLLGAPKRNGVSTLIPGCWRAEICALDSLCRIQFHDCLVVSTVLSSKSMYDDFMLRRNTAQGAVLGGFWEKDGPMYRRCNLFAANEVAEVVAAIGFKMSIRVTAQIPMHVARRSQYRRYARVQRQLRVRHTLTTAAVLQFWWLQCCLLFSILGSCNATFVFCCAAAVLPAILVVPCAFLCIDGLC